VTRRTLGTITETERTAFSGAGPGSWKRTADRAVTSSRPGKATRIQGARDWSTPAARNLPRSLVEETPP